MTNDSKPHRVWYPPFSIGFLAISCLMKAYLQVHSIFIVNKILRMVPGQPPTTPVIPWQPIVLVAVLLMTAIGLWFEQSWARWIARVWASFDVVTRLLFSLGIVGTIGPHFNWSGWVMAISFFGFAWFSKFRWEGSLDEHDGADWDIGESEGEFNDDVDIDFKLAPAYEPANILWTSYQLHTRNGVETVVDKFISCEPTKIGMLPLLTGRIVAMDPMQGQTYDREFEEAVPPGRYPVFLTSAKHLPDRELFVAYAAIRFNENVPVRWRPASLTCVNEPDIPVDALPSMYTDSAMGCYVDAGTLSRCRETGVEFATFERLSENLTDERLGIVAELRPGEPDCAMALFFTGNGDGVYNSYWGIDEAGETCALVTDFDLNDGTSRNPLLRARNAAKKHGIELG